MKALAEMQGLFYCTTVNKNDKFALNYSYDFNKSKNCNKYKKPHL